MATTNKKYGEPRFLFYLCIQKFLNINCGNFYQLSISIFQDMKCDRISLSLLVEVSSD